MSSDDLVRHRRELSAAKRQAVLDAIPRVLDRGDPLTFPAVATEAGVSRAFIYADPTTKQAVEKARAVQSRPATEPAQVRALRSEAARLRELLKTERLTTLDLRKQLRRAWGGAIEDVPAADLTQRITDLEKRNSELARQLREVENDRADKVTLLEQTTEQLDSARSLNRQMMRERNAVADVPDDPKAS